ncbi:hypothetical protein G7046_g9594 [Stylonectria norvegica]|nr:hypothetical protein G7046_g9594 [Stylonectria norvegica]
MNASLIDAIRVMPLEIGISAVSSWVKLRTKTISNFGVSSVVRSRTLYPNTADKYARWKRGIGLTENQTINERQVWGRKLNPRTTISLPQTPNHAQEKSIRKNTLPPERLGSNFTMADKLAVPSADGDHQLRGFVQQLVWKDPNGSAFAPRSMTSNKLSNHTSITKLFQPPTNVLGAIEYVPRPLKTSLQVTTTATTILNPSRHLTQTATMSSPLRALLQPSSRLTLAALRPYHTSRALFAYKDSQDRESLRPSTAENTKSGRDDEAATAAAFDPSTTSPEAAKAQSERRAGRQRDARGQRREPGAEQAGGR